MAYPNLNLKNPFFLSTSTIFIFCKVKIQHIHHGKFHLIFLFFDSKNHPVQADYGRNRNSIIDIEDQLDTLFSQYSTNPRDDDGPPKIRVDKLPDVLHEVSDFHGGPILTDDEMEGFHRLIAADPSLAVTPELVLSLIATRTKQNQERNADSEGDDNSVDRGRGSDRDNDAIQTHSRSSSSSSTAGTPVHGSRPPSRGLPQTPTSAKSQSVFDTSRRQRALPLSNNVNAPSSWTKTRPGPGRRRNSDAGSRSDSEVISFSSLH